MTMPRFEPFPATTSSRILSALSAFIMHVREEHLHHRALKDNRAAFMRMASLDDSTLDDIGVTRDDIAWAAALPLEVNAALAVRERTNLRRNANAEDASNPLSGLRSKTDGSTALQHMPSVVAARWFCFGQKPDID